MKFNTTADDRFIIKSSFFNNRTLIEKRVSATSVEVHGALRTALLFLYCDNGPKNLPVPRRRLAEQHLSDAERIVVRRLASRTNGGNKRIYGQRAYRAAKRARYRCSVCGWPDIRSLHLDHVGGKRVARSRFQCVCANWHNIKSRMKDWTGKKKKPGAFGAPGKLPPCEQGRGGRCENTPVFKAVGAREM